MLKSIDLESFKDNKKTEYIDVLEKRVEENKKNIEYALSRIDILIISLSTAALAFSLTTLNKWQENGDQSVPTIFKISIFLFSFSIILNLTSQYTSYNAHKHDNEYTKEIIREKRNKKPKKNREVLIVKMNLYNTCTILANQLSFFSLIIGILISIITILLK